MPSQNILILIFLGLSIVFIQHTTGCPDGFYGINCEIPCRYPNFGHGCQQNCNCTKEFCDFIKGCRTNTGCPNGFYGVKCRYHCRYPNYGVQCQSLCACESQLCNHISGCIFSTGCPDGFYGIACKTPCDYPRFGRDCQKMCNCTEEICDSVKGCPTNLGFRGLKCRYKCRYPNYGDRCHSLCTNLIFAIISSTDCEDGYSGALCTTPCKYPWYGYNCKHKCNCTLTNCNHTNGCQDTSEHEDEVAEKFEKAAIIGSCSVFILVTLILIIMVRKYRSSRKQVNKHNYTPTLISPIPEHANYDKVFRQKENDYLEICENTHNTSRA